MNDLCEQKGEQTAEEENRLLREKIKTLQEQVIEPWDGRSRRDATEEIRQALRLE